MGGSREIPDPEARVLFGVVVLPPKCEEDAFPVVAFLDTLPVELAGSGLACRSLVIDSARGLPTIAELSAD